MKASHKLLQAKNHNGNDNDGNWANHDNDNNRDNRDNCNKQDTRDRRNNRDKSYIFSHTFVFFQRFFIVNCLKNILFVGCCFFRHMYVCRFIL